MSAPIDTSQVMSVLDMMEAAEKAKKDPLHQAADRLQANYEKLRAMAGYPVGVAMQSVTWGHFLQTAKVLVHRGWQGYCHAYLEVQFKAVAYSRPEKPYPHARELYGPRAQHRFQEYWEKRLQASADPKGVTTTVTPYDAILGRAQSDHYQASQVAQAQEAQEAGSTGGMAGAHFGSTPLERYLVAVRRLSHRLSPHYLVAVHLLACSGLGEDHHRGQPQPYLIQRQHQRQPGHQELDRVTQEGRGRGESGGEGHGQVGARGVRRSVDGDYGFLATCAGGPAQEEARAILRRHRLRPLREVDDILRHIERDVQLRGA